MSDPQALHVTRNVIPGKLGVDLHLHRVHNTSSSGINIVLKIETVCLIRRLHLFVLTVACKWRITDRTVTACLQVRWRISWRSVWREGRRSPMTLTG